MVKVIELGRWALAHYMELIVAVNAVVGSLIAVALIIPGEQPEKALQKAADFLAKFSKK